MKSQTTSLNKLGTLLATIVKLVAVLSPVVPTLACASIIAQDDFDSYTAGNLSGQNGGTGWSAAWTGTTAATVVDTSAAPLNFTPVGGTVIAGGSKAAQVSSASAIVGSRQFTSQTGTFYVGYLFRWATGVLDGTDTVTLHLASTATDSSNSFDFGPRNGFAASQPAVIVRKGTGNVSATEGADWVRCTDATVTHFLVAKVSKSGTGNYDTINVWLDPGVTSETTTPTGNFRLTSTSTVTPIQYLNLRVAGLTSGDKILVDHLVVGQTFADLMPAAGYKVTYDANSGSGVQTDNTAYGLGSTVTVLGPGTLTKPGYTFAGWNTAADGSGTAYSAGNTFAIIGDTTLYARWTFAGYLVTYNANGGSGAPTDSTAYIPNATVTVLDPGGMIRTGFTFAGWNTAANGTGTAYPAGATFSISAAIILYAQWTINSYIVTYDSNGSDGGSVPVDNGSPYPYASTVTVLVNTNGLVKTAYTFAGWNTAASGVGTAYGAGNTFVMPPANMTLYAQWTLATLTWSGTPVSYDWNTADANWTGGNGVYADPFAVRFDDNGSDSTPINLIGTLNPTSVTVDTSARSYVLVTNAGGKISGPATLTKSGSATLTVATANDYTGATTVNGGTLVLNGSGSLGNGSDLTLSGGALDLGGLSPAVGAFTIAAPTSSGDTLRNGSLTATRYAVSSASNVNLSANLLANGTAGLAKSGAGTLTLSGNNSYIGGTTSSGGILAANHDSAFGSGSVVIGAGAVRLVINDGVSIANDIMLSSTGTAARGIIENSGAGNATLSGGIITIQTAATVGGHFGSGNGGTLTIDDPINASPTTVVISQRVGTVIYRGGGSCLNFMVEGGTAKLGANNGLSTAATVSISKLNSPATSANLDLAGYNQALSGITKGGSYSAIIGNSSTTHDSLLTLTGTSTFAGVIQNTLGSGTKKVALTVNGGTLTLSGVNTYTGDTTVESGILAVNGSSINDADKLIITGGKVQPTGTETVNTLFFGPNPSDQAAAGTWGASGSGATHIDDVHFTGTAGVVMVISDPPLAAYGIWATTDHGLSGPDADLAADPDHDGQSNLAEFALAGDPTSGTVSGKVRTRVTIVGGDPALVITLPIRGTPTNPAFTGSAGKSATVDGVVYIIEGTDDLTHFDKVVTEITAETDMPVPVGSGWTYRTFRLEGAVGTTNPMGFLRVRLADATAN